MDSHARLITSELGFNVPTTLMIRYALWGVLAALAGAAIALVPSPMSALALGALVLLALSVYSPFALFAALLVLSPLRTLIQTEAPLSLPLDIGQILLLLFAGVWGVHRLLHSRRILTFRITALALPLGLFVLWGLMSWLWAWSLTAAITEGIKWVTILLVAVFVYYHAGSGRWRLFVAALVIAATANAIVGIYIFFGGSGADHLLIGGRFFRAFGTFGQPNPFGGFMGIIFPLSLAVAVDYGHLWYKHRQAQHAAVCAAALACAGLIAAALVMSWSRGAWLSVIGAVFVMGILLPRRLIHSFFLFVALSALGLIIWTSGVLPASIAQRISSSTEEFFAFEDMRGVNITTENYAVVERLAHWQAALNMAQAHPFGVGIGNFNAAYAPHRLLNWPQPLGHAHNYYLNVLAETGIIGLAAYLVFQGSTLLFAARGRAHPSASVRYLAVALVGSWVYVSLHSVLDNLYVNNVFIHVGVLLGLTFWVYQQSTLTTATEYHGNRATI